MRNIIYAMLCVPSMVYGKCTEELAHEFLGDQSHELIYRVERLPDDVREMLFATTHTENIANYGEYYNKTDVILSRSEPMKQHQFSLVSSNTAAVLFRSGGLIRTETVLLVSRKDTGARFTYDVQYPIDNEGTIRGLIARHMRAEISKRENLKGIRERAEAGDPEAQLQLYYGEGKAKSDLKWLCRAADQGQRHAQRELAGAYARGTPMVERDEVQAQVWYTLAVRGGAEEYRSRLEELAASMTPEQGEEVARRLEAWAPGQCEQALVPAKRES